MRVVDPETDGTGADAVCEAGWRLEEPVAGAPSWREIAPKVPNIPRTAGLAAYCAALSQRERPDRLFEMCAAALA